MNGVHWRTAGGRHSTLGKEGGGDTSDAHERDQRQQHDEGSHEPEAPRRPGQARWDARLLTRAGSAGCREIEAAASAAAAHHVVVHQARHPRHLATHPRQLVVHLREPVTHRRHLACQSPDVVKVVFGNMEVSVTINSSIFAIRRGFADRDNVSNLAASIPVALY